MNLRFAPSWTTRTIGLFVSTAIAALLLSIALSTPIAHARIVRTAETAQKIYTELPEIPLENQYFNQKLKKIDPNNTLINRILRYHAFTKGRPADIRLDWKLTLADYLGANDIMDPATYPSHDVLNKNPLDNDRAAVNTLTRSMRDQLIDRLIQLSKTLPNVKKFYNKNSSISITSNYEMSVIIL